MAMDHDLLPHGFVIAGSYFPDWMLCVLIASPRRPLPGSCSHFRVATTSPLPTFRVQRGCLTVPSSHGHPCPGTSRACSGMLPLNLRCHAQSCLI